MVPVTALLGPPPLSGAVVVFAKASGKCGGLGFWAFQPSPGGLGLELSPRAGQWSNSVVLNTGQGALQGPWHSQDSFGCYNLGGAIGI